MEEILDPPKVNFVSCVKVVKQGVSKAHPIQIQLSKTELIELNKNDKKELETVKGNLSCSENNSSKKHNDVEDIAEKDEFNMEHYSDDEEMPLKISDLVVFDENDPHDLPTSHLIDSEEEDDIIKPEDNLILVGHVEGMTPILEVYVYNEKEDSLYVHHDYLLPNIPLAMEWLNYDPANPNEPANLCAVGYVSPIIGIWDLDIVNCVEPVIKLGRKRNSKKGTSRVGHKKAVLDLSWNQNYHHILASGSVDKSLILWDLDKAEPNITVSAFDGNVQSLEWHPNEGQTLLAGSADKTCKVFDCRTSDNYKSWNVKGEVEKVLWNTFNPQQFFASDDKGFLYGFDCRQDKKLWKVKSHAQGVSGLASSSKCEGFLCTTSGDGLLKIWDVLKEKPELIDERNLKVGAVHCLEAAPDLPFTIVSGGDNKDKNLVVFNTIRKKKVKEAFENRTSESKPVDSNQRIRKEAANQLFKGN